MQAIGLQCIPELCAALKGLLTDSEHIVVRQATVAEGIGAIVRALSRYNTPLPADVTIASFPVQLKYCNADELVALLPDAPVAGSPISLRECYRAVL